MDFVEILGKELKALFFKLMQMIYDLNRTLILDQNQLSERVHIFVK